MGLLRKSDDSTFSGFETAWEYLALSVIAVLFFTLSNLNEDVEFKTPIIFMMVLLSAFVFMMVLTIMTWIKNHMRGDSGIQFFFLAPIKKKQLWIIPAGYITILVISLAISSQNWIIDGRNASAITSIAVSGLIMGLVLFHTKHILYPILIHGLFNSTVVILRQSNTNSFLSTSPVPEVGINVYGLNSLASEILFQNILVATSEEMLKILIISFVVVTQKGSFSKGGRGAGWKWVGLLLADIAWTAFHTIQAVR